MMRLNLPVMKRVATPKGKKSFMEYQAGPRTISRTPNYTNNHANDQIPIFIDDDDDIVEDVLTEDSENDIEEVDDEDLEALREISQSEFSKHTRIRSELELPPNCELVRAAPLGGGNQLLAGSNVELENNEFMRITHILRNKALGNQPQAFILRGRLMRRARHMSNMFQKFACELVAMVFAEDGDQRPDFVRGLEDRPLASVICIRQITFTNAIFPDYSFRVIPGGCTFYKTALGRNGLPETKFDALKADTEARLVCRWKSVQEYVTKGRNHELRLEKICRITPEEADEGCSRDCVELYKQYRHMLLVAERQKKSNETRQLREKFSRLAFDPARPWSVASAQPDTSLIINLDESDDDIIEIEPVAVKKRRTTLTEESGMTESVFSQPVGENAVRRFAVTKFHGQTFSKHVEAGPSRRSSHRPGQTSLQHGKARVRGSQLVPTVYSVGDLFSGGGGVSEGAKMAGLRVKYAVDKKPCAVRTHQHNNPGCKTLLRDVGDFLMENSLSPDDFEVQICHASCPCQFWSPNHTCAGKNDSENMASSYMVQPAAKKSRCRIMTFEQTPGLNRLKKHRQHWQMFLNQFTSMGFDVMWKVINLATLGNPHPRKRLMIFAACPGQQLPDFPEPTHGDGPGLKPFVTINEAIKDIPHWATMHNPEEMRQAQRVKPRKFDEIADGNKPLRWIIDTSGSRAAHPDGDRAFTVRESMRLQSMPDTCEPVCNSRSEAIEMVGDAVPSGPMSKLFKKCKQALKKTDAEIASYKPPMLDLDSD